MSNISSTDGRTPQSVPTERPTTPRVQVKVPGKALATASPAQDVAIPASVRPTNSQPSPEELKRITEELRRRINAAAPELEFTVDQHSGRSIIKITDRETNEVIQQIPSEDTLRLNEALDRFQKGLLLNRKA